MSAPLAGFKILDLTRLLPGPLCSLHLADLGAEVIKIEDPSTGDPTRADITGRQAMSTLFHCLNRNKHAVAIDLRTAEGVEIFLTLAEQADAIIEGFRPGVVDRLGVGYAAVKARRADTVYVSLTGYGQDGPWKHRAGHDVNYVATAGILDQLGEAGGPPILPNFQIADLAGGALSATVAVLAALLRRSSSGEGSYVDVSMTDCALAHAVMPLAQMSLFGGTPPRGLDILTGGLACYSIYRTADDRHLAVGALERKFWDQVCAGLGRMDLADLHLSLGPAAVELKATVQGIIGAQPLAHWAEVFEALDACVTPVLTLEEAMTHPQLAARHIFIEHTDPRDGVIKQFATPWKFADHVFSVRRSAPPLGADTEAVLTAAGIDAPTLHTLKARGIVR
ncbi:MAG: CaiB/BaiF CoA transferase family protein [Bradymonadia bacterium]